MVRPRMARYAHDGSMAVSSGGSWSKLLYFLVAAAGVGFAGYVYLVPYQKMERAVGSNQSAVADEHRAAESALAERDRLKADLAKYNASASDKSSAEAKQKTTIDTLATQLRPGLEALGATVVADASALQVSFPAAKMIDANGIDVSDGGMAAIKIMADAAKRETAKVRIRARSSAAAPPKELRSLFHTAGEMNAVRAARVMSSLEHAGVAPARLSIFGDVADKSQRPARPARGKKAAPVAQDRVELEIEPE
jgi:hypothetical protein